MKTKNVNKIVMFNPLVPHAVYT